MKLLVWEKKINQSKKPGSTYINSVKEGYLKQNHVCSIWLWKYIQLYNELQGTSNNNNDNI